MNKNLLIGLCIIGLLLLLFLPAYYHKQQVGGLPPKYECSSKQEAWDKAVKEENCLVIGVQGTGSMEPFISSHPIKETVVAYATISLVKKYKDISVGKLCVYVADWTTPPKQLVIHQAVLKDGDGWIMSGLNNKHYEMKYRVDENNFLGVVESVYVW